MTHRYLCSPQCLVALQLKLKQSPIEYFEENELTERWLENYKKVL